MALDLGRDDVRVQALTEVLEEFNLLGSPEARGLQLGTVAVRQRWKIRAGLGLVWIHGWDGDDMVWLVWREEARERQL